jgi:hypothetical protein
MSMTLILEKIKITTYRLVLSVAHLFKPFFRDDFVGVNEGVLGEVV